MPIKIASKSLFLILTVSLFAVALFSFRPADKRFSRFVSRYFRANIELKTVRWKPLLGVAFQNASVLDSKGKQWLQCGAGDFQWRYGPGGLGMRINLTDFFIFTQDNEALHFQKSKLFMKSKGHTHRLHILKMKSPPIELKGSVQWEDGHLDKASLAILMSKAWAERLPDHLDRRLSSAAGGDKKILKCAYSRNHLLFYGRSGVLLRATWSPEL